MSIDTFNLFLGVMSLIALFVFIALYFVKAGYGIFRTASWGVAISNKLAWILMEAPVFVVMCVMWIYSARRFEPVILIFYLAPETMYQAGWFTSPWFIFGTLFFFAGMLLNWQSDYIIRHLRKPGDTRHYLPQKGMYRYVTSANYFGEIVEWAGWAILTCSLSGLVFLWWTIANLVPRANAIWCRYREEFGDAVGERKRVFPFLY